jgi:hypothetical protein
MTTLPQQQQLLRHNLPPDTAKILLERTVVYLVENLHLPGVDFALSAITYEGSQISYDVVLQVLEHIHRAEADDLCSFADKVGTIIAVPDTLTQVLAAIDPLPHSHPSFQHTSTDSALSNSVSWHFAFLRLNREFATFSASSYSSSPFLLLRRPPLSFLH